MTECRAALLAEIAELGQEFSRLGWTKRLPPLREFYAAVAAGAERTEQWSVELVANLRRVMGLGPGALPRATRCPNCERRSDGSWNGARTTMHLEDRWAMRCSNCGAEWVVFVDAPHKA